MKHATDTAGSATTDEVVKIFNPEKLSSLISVARDQIVSDKCFPYRYKNELHSYQFEGNEFSELYQIAIKLFRSLLKNNDITKFYTDYFGSITLNSEKYFIPLPTKTATLISTKLADVIVKYHKEQSSANQDPHQHKEKVLTKRESYSLQYLAGYVVHNLYKKFRNAQNWKSKEAQQCISVLMACKVDDELQRLVSSLSRGGLWAVVKPVHDILSLAEKKFCNETESHHISSIDVPAMTNELTKNPSIIAWFNLLLDDAETQTENHVAKNLLYKIIELYLKVRSHSYAKDVIEKCKMKQKKTKSKALRKELSRASTETQE